MNFLGFGQSADLDIAFDDAEERRQVEVKMDEGKKEKLYLYYDGESIKGKVRVCLRKPGQKLEHHGIKIELIGQIELYYDRGNHYEFLTMAKELARPGDLLQNTEYPFEFMNVEKPFEIYMGANVRLRYFLRITVIRRISDLIREVDICVHTLSSYPDSNNPIKMEVGIEDCLHIEFEYNKCKYHLKDVIVGKIYFLLVRIKIKHMEIAIIKREQTGTGPQQYLESETIAKYEIMDGAPVKGESIPIRVFLAGYDLTPTMRDSHKKFSVKYFLNLVLMDTEDRRYFKQQEITLWRKADSCPLHNCGTGKRIGPHQALAAGQMAGGNANGDGDMNNPHIPSHLVGSSENSISDYNSTEQQASGVQEPPLVGERSPTDDLEDHSGGGGETNRIGLFTEDLEKENNVPRPSSVSIDTPKAASNESPTVAEAGDDDDDDGGNKRATGGGGATKRAEAKAGPQRDGANEADNDTEDLFN